MHGCNGNDMAWESAKASQNRAAPGSPKDRSFLGFCPRCHKTLAVQARDEWSAEIEMIFLHRRECPECGGRVEFMQEVQSIMAIADPNPSEIDEARANQAEREEWSRALLVNTKSGPPHPTMPDEFGGRLGLYPFRLRPKEFGLGVFCGELKTAGLIASVNLDSLKVVVTVLTPIEQGEDMEIMTLAQVGYANRIRLDEMTVFPAGSRQYRFY